MKSNQIYPGLFLLFSLLYLGLMIKVPFTADWLIKALPALTLGAWALTSLQGKHRWLLVVAMIFSAGGDIALAMVPKGKEDFFIVGLGSFLIAHIFYIILFNLDRKYQPNRLWAALGVGGFAIVMAILLFPKLGPLQIPVMVYLTVIATMGISAAFNLKGGILLVLGAMVFMLSDATIAINKFMLAEPIPALQYVIIVTYFGAQYMIARSFVGKA
ncbi:MAG: lysoplasmalogenase [Bacteroidia bacterium]|nr:lysoplasmalogenase [Bacteroidia bacterium]